METMAQQDDKAQHLFVIRHGDRWDYHHKDEWKSDTNRRDGDPPLSSLGMQQSREVGLYLDNILEQLDIKDITWMSSPFLRCLQTSELALSSFSKVDVSSLPILPEYSVFEWDGKGGKWHESLPTLAERKHYFPRISIDYKSMFHPTLPEPRHAFRERCQKVVTSLSQRIPYRPNSAIVIVTHAAACIGISVAAADCQNQHVTPAAPASIYGLSRSSGCQAWNLPPHDAPESWNGYTSHLSKLDGKTVPWNHFGSDKGYTGPPTSRFAPTDTQK
jgi:broad specificity phosphatase PhoE